MSRNTAPRQIDSTRMRKKISDGTASEATIAVTVLVILFALLLLLLSGCREVAPQSVPPRIPVISMADAYPDGQTAADFWAAKNTFFREYADREARGVVTLEESTVFKHLQDIELLRRAGEAKIRRFNTWAKSHNEELGYQ